MGCLSLLQGIFPTQGSNPGLLHHRRILYQLSYDGSPIELFQILKDDAVKVLQSMCQQIWKTQQWPQDWKRSVFIPIPKKGNAKECSNSHTTALISHSCKVMFKILQARLQQYMNCESPDVGTLVAQRLKRLPPMRERPGFNPWVGKIPWRRKWQSTPVFLPGNPMDGEA